MNAPISDSIKMHFFKEAVPSTSSNSFGSTASHGHPVTLSVLASLEPGQQSADANCQNLQFISAQPQSNDGAEKIIRFSYSIPLGERDLQPLHLSQVEPGGFVTIPKIVPDPLASSSTEISSTSSQVKKI